MAKSVYEVDQSQTKWTKGVGLTGPKGKKYTGWVNMTDGSRVQYKNGKRVIPKPVTPGTPGTPGSTGTATTPAGNATPAAKPLPGSIVALGSQYLAGQTQLQANARRDSASRRGRLSTDVIGAGSAAADIYGGRAPGIFGQALTGARRRERQLASSQALTQKEQEKALMDSYTSALGEEYGSLSQQVLDEARRRSENMATINRVGP